MPTPFVSHSFCALSLFCCLSACADTKTNAFNSSPDDAGFGASGSGGRLAASQGQGGIRSTAEGGGGVGGLSAGGMGVGGVMANPSSDAGSRDTGRPDGTGDGQDAGLMADAVGGDAGAVAQTPPMGKQALLAWLMAGHYKTWKCEATVMSGRANGHGRNRICSNSLTSAHGAGSYPVGAASVKELYSGATINGYAVSRKIKDGPEANTWYWYENGTEGIGISGCADCHSKAKDRQGNDYVYIQVK